MLLKRRRGARAEYRKGGQAILNALKLRVGRPPPNSKTPDYFQKTPLAGVAIYPSLLGHKPSVKGLTEMTAKRQTDLFPYLACRRDPIVDSRVASRFNIERAALVEIVREQIGPDAFMPAEASGHFWFSNISLLAWESWPKTACEEEIIRAAEIIRKHDQARRIREYASWDNEEARSFLVHVFKRKWR